MARKGFLLTEEHKSKIGEANKTALLGNTNAAGKWSLERRLRQSARLRGIKRSLETRRAMSERRKGRYPESFKKCPVRYGPETNNWRGGISAANELVRKSARYKAWRRHVFQRDDYTCQACGRRGGKLHADHELPFALYPDLRFEILNGRTLCEGCHFQTPTYGGKTRQGKIRVRAIHDFVAWNKEI